MIASNVVGQVTSFFLIANGDTEIDIELTGLNNSIGWMNVWHAGKQNPISLDLPFDSSKDWHKYSFDWFNDHIVWYIDDKLVLNRSDIPTTSPDLTNYKLVINSWTQIQPEIGIKWAGAFSYPVDGIIPHAQFRNMEYLPRVYDADGVPHSVDNGIFEIVEKPHTNGTGSNGHPSNGTNIPTSSSAELPVNTQTILVNGGTAILAVVLAFTILF
ncbi:hypothetical protein BGZ76_010872 [Entomortierella beljakovae]|nr:hypothetical protein BGZ76_010872 [Entomortierella beljakovae]